METCEYRKINMNNILKSKKGETLIETLVSLLIGCAAILIMFNYINSAKSLIEETDKTMSDYYDKNNEIISQGIEADSKGTVSFSKAIIPGENNISVNFYVNDVYKTNKVVMYGRDTNE